MKALLNWGDANGARVRKLIPAGRCFMSQGIHPGLELMCIPQSHLLHVFHTDFSQYAGELLQGHNGEAGASRPDPRHILCVLLILERAREDKSRWAPYLDILPDCYDDPYWWQPDQVHLLKGTRLGRAVNSNKHDSGITAIARHARHLEALISQNQPPGSPPSVLATYRGGWALTEDAARWARSVVWSRAFTVPRLQCCPPNTVALVPLLDMIDHNPRVEALWHTGEDGTSDFRFVTLTPFAQGSRVFNNYGTKPSEELLLGYGFLLPDNEADYFHVSIAHNRPSPSSRQQGQGDHQGHEHQHDQQLHGQQQQQTEQEAEPQITDLEELQTLLLQQQQQGTMEEDEDDPGSVAARQQAEAEIVQRELLLGELHVDLEYHLKAGQALPHGLVQAAELCLEGAPKLFGQVAHKLQPAQVKLQPTPTKHGSKEKRLKKRKSQSKECTPPSEGQPANKERRRSKGETDKGTEGEVEEQETHQPDTGVSTSSMRRNGSQGGDVPQCVEVGLQDSQLQSGPSLPQANGKQPFSGHANLKGWSPSKAARHEQQPSSQQALPTLQQAPCIDSPHTPALPGVALASHQPAPTVQQASCITPPAAPALPEMPPHLAALLPIMASPSAMHVKPASASKPTGTSERVGPSGASNGAGAAGAQLPNQSDAPPVHPPLRLRALVSLHEQLTAKLEGMVSEQEEQAAWAGAQQQEAQLKGQVERQQQERGHASTSQTHSSQASASHPEPPQSPSNTLPNPQHTRLALQYVTRQKQILKGALIQLQGCIHDLLHRLAAQLPTTHSQHGLTTAATYQATITGSPLELAPLASHVPSSPTLPVPCSSYSSQQGARFNRPSPGSNVAIDNCTCNTVTDINARHSSTRNDGSGPSSGSHRPLACSIDLATHLTNYRGWLQEHELLPVATSLVVIENQQQQQGSAHTSEAGVRNLGAPPCTEPGGGLKGSRLQEVYMRRAAHTGSGCSMANRGSLATSTKDQKCNQGVANSSAGTCRSHQSCKANGSGTYSNCGPVEQGSNGVIGGSEGTSCTAGHPALSGPTVAKGGPMHTHAHASEGGAVYGGGDRVPPGRAQSFRMPSQRQLQKQQQVQQALQAGVSSQEGDPSQAANAADPTPPSTEATTAAAPPQATTASAAAAVNAQSVHMSLPHGIAASLGLESDLDPVAYGAQLVADAGAGEELLRVSAACCLVADTKMELVANLMSSAHRLLQALLAVVAPHAATMLDRASSPAELAAAAACTSGAQVELKSSQDMLVWHLMHFMGSSTAARLGMADAEGVQMLMDMLEDSPAGNSYQEAFESLQGEFAAQRAVGLLRTPKVDPLWQALSTPSAFRLFCWAYHVVNRCAVEAGTRDAHSYDSARRQQQQRKQQPQEPKRQEHHHSCAQRHCPCKPQLGDSSIAGPQQDATPVKQWCLVPIVCATPLELRDATMGVELELAGEGTNGGHGGVPRHHYTHGHQLEQQPGTLNSSQCPLHVVARAKCCLQAGLPLTPLLLLPYMDCCELMVTYGPEALPWFGLVQQHHHPLQQQQQHNQEHCPLEQPQQAATDLAHHHQLPLQQIPELGTPPTLSPSTTPHKASSIQLVSTRCTPPLLYELYICPREDDALCMPKLELLAACGLGSVHYLTESMVSEWMVSSALKICLAGGELLSHPLAQHCVRAHKVLMELPWQLQEARTHKSTPDVNAQQQQLKQNSKSVASACSDTEVTMAGLVMATAAEGKNTPKRAADQAACTPKYESDEEHAAAMQAARQALLDAQRQLVAFLASQPDTHADVRAARKQLRQMVQEARKNSYRRLRQLEVVHAHVGLRHLTLGSSRSGLQHRQPAGQHQHQHQHHQHSPRQQQVGLGLTDEASGASESAVKGVVLPSSAHSANSSAIKAPVRAFSVAPRAPPISSSTTHCMLGGSTALHEGVWLYLGAVCGVLDAWAGSLGLGGSSRLGEGKSKSQKRTYPG